MTRLISQRSWWRWMLASIGVTVSAVAAQQPAERPNIVFMLADDLGYGDRAHCS